MLLGCIADDFTGATDLANMLVRGGMRTVQTIGVPSRPVSDADAVVVALKSRTIPPDEAVAQSLAALDWLRSQGGRQFFFKYCSTFDSTDKGNIGPVTDALMRSLGTKFSIACPAFPENGRTICHGYLFVGDVLLSESGMRNHPLTPMTDPNLVRVLQRQTSRKVGLVRFDDVARGAEAICSKFAALGQASAEIAVVDALSDADLYAIGAACVDMPLVTGGSGVAIGLPENFRQAGLLGDAARASELPRFEGYSAVVSGSCSVATNGQVEAWRNVRPAFHIDPLALAAGRDVAGEALEWADPLLAKGPVLVYATAQPDEVKKVQAQLGVERAGSLIEECIARIAAGLVERGVNKLVVAGGETSGAVVSALGIEALRIGPQIDPGVPWTASMGGRQVALALKSGNFGTVDFFSKALAVVDGGKA